MTNTTTITSINDIKTGKCQFNATSAKAIRNKLAKYKESKCSLADAVAKKQDSIKAFKAIIASNMNSIELMESGETVSTKRTLDEIKQENINFTDKINVLNIEYDNLVAKQAKRIKDAESLVSDSMYDRYVDYITIGDRESKDAYYIAIAQFLSDNSIEPCMDTIKSLADCNGKVENKGKKLIKNNGILTSAKSLKSWRTMFLNELCDLMGDTLPTFKFTYKPQDSKKTK